VLWAQRGDAASVEQQHDHRDTAKHHANEEVTELAE
jgi:hypothetical protein